MKRNCQSKLLQTKAFIHQTVPLLHPHTCFLATCLPTLTAKTVICCEVKVPRNTLATRSTHCQVLAAAVAHDNTFYSYAAAVPIVSHTWEVASTLCVQRRHSDRVPTTSQDNTMHLWRVGCKPSLSQTHPPPPTSSHTDMHLHTQYIRTYANTYTHTHTHTHTHTTHTHTHTQHTHTHTHTHISHTLVHTCIHIRMQIHQHIQLTNADIDISLPFGGVRIVERCTLLTLPPCSVVHAVDTDSPTDSACSLVH